jgi:hypothetical protein
MYPQSNAKILLDEGAVTTSLDLIKEAGPNLELQSKFAYVQRCLSTILRIASLQMKDINQRIKVPIIRLYSII